MTSAEIRKAFLQFFEEKDIKFYPVLLLSRDPTMLLTIAGMDTLLNILKVEYHLPFIEQLQCKCVRISDLDKVGYTSRHHTF